jgi:hypothetical protein
MTTPDYKFKFKFKFKNILLKRDKGLFFTIVHNNTDLI